MEHTHLCSVQKGRLTASVREKPLRYGIEAIADIKKRLKDITGIAIAHQNVHE